LVVLFSDILHFLGSPRAPITFRASGTSGQLLPCLTSRVSFIYYVPFDVPGLQGFPLLCLPLTSCND
jgi:hypothetical protein